MSFSAMDLGWKRIHLLVIILICLKNAVGHEGWRSLKVYPQQNWPARKPFSPSGVQSSVEAPVSGSIPVEEVVSNTFAAKSQNPSRSRRYSFSSQSVKGGFSSSYEPMSPTQSAPSVLDSVSSLLQLQGSSSPSAKNVVPQSASRQGSYSWSAPSSPDASGLASTPAQGSSSSGLSVLSQGSPSLSAPGSLSKLSFSPLNVSGLPVSVQSSSNMFAANSQSSSGLQLGETANLLSTQSSSSTGSSGSSRSLFTSPQGSSGPQLAGGYSQLVSTSGLLAQSPSTETRRASGSSYAKLAASPLGFSQSTSGQSSYGRYTSSSQSGVGTQVAASHQYQPGQGSGYGLSVQPQGTISQYAPSRFSSLSSAGGSFSATDGSSVQSQGTSSQNTLSPFGPKVTAYSQAAPSGSSLSLGQPSQWQSSVSRSQSFQTSGAVASQSSSPSQGFKAPSRFSTSAVSPSQFASTQKGSGLSVQSQSTSSQYSPGPSAYAKPAASPLGVSRSTSGQSSYNQYTSSSQSRAGTQLAGTSPFAPLQTGSMFTGGSSPQLQGTSSQYAPSPLDTKVPVYSQVPSGPSYAPASLDAKVPVYSQAPSSGSSALSQASRWEPSTSRWSQGFQTSGTVASQSSSPSQYSKAPSRFSTFASVASPSQFASTQEGSARYSGLSIQGTSSLYSPGSYAKLAASPLGVSQSTSGPSSYNQYTSSSQSRVGTQLAGSSPYAPMQMAGTSTDGSSLQLQGTSSLYAPSPSSAKVYSQAAPSGPSLSLGQPSQWQTSSRWSQGFQTSGTVASQSGSLSQASKAPSRFPTPSSAARPGQFASAQERSGRYSGLSSLSQATSSQYGSGSPAYAKRGSSFAVSSQSTSDQSSSGLYASSSQSMTETQLAGSSRYVPLQTGSALTGGSSLQFQGTSNQYAPSVSSQYTPASPSGFSLTGSSGKWQTSASSLSQGFQASAAAVPPQSSQTSSGSSFLAALSPSVDSLAQSSSSRRTTSFFGAGLRPSKLSAQAASGSKIGSQLSPALSADSMTSSLGSSVQGTSQGTFSGQSSDSTSVMSSNYGFDYGQRASGFSRSTGRYSSVKG